MSPLSQVVTFHDDETVASFCSRLAAANGIGSAREFCSHFGISFQHVVDGDPSAIVSLSRLSANPPAAIERGVIIRRGRQFVINGQLLLRSNLVRNRLRACPYCIRDDQLSGLGPQCSLAYGRIHWLVSSVRTCPIHSVTLALSTQVSGPEELHDFANHVMKQRASWQEFECQAVPATHSAFEEYIIARLQGVARHPQWLDSIPLYAACKLTELVGGMLLNGHRFNSDEMSEAEWMVAAEKGFDITSSGLVGIEAYLDRLHENFWAARTDFGGRAIYGRLYEFLAHENDDPAYDPVRSLIGQTAVASLPIGLDHRLFGATPARQWHSIRSASEEFGIHRSTLRKLLLAADLISPDSNGAADSRVMIDANTMEAFVERLRTRMTSKEASTYITASVSSWKILVSSGYVKPMLMGDGKNNAAAVYDKGKLDELLSRLRDAISVKFDQESGLMGLRDAARKSNCQLREILDLLFAGTLKTVSSDPRHDGFESLLVDSSEIRALVRLPELQGMTLRAAERVLGTTTSVIENLVRHGYLETETGINPINRCAQTIVRHEELERFARTHRSLYRHAQDTGVHIRKAKKKLQDAGVAPSITSEEVGCTFYRLSDLAER